MENQEQLETSFISIDYDEGNQESYRGVRLTLNDPDGSSRSMVIDHKSPHLDFAIVYGIACQYSEDIFVNSSVDRFIDDGDKYVWVEFEGGIALIDLAVNHE